MALKKAWEVCPYLNPKENDGIEYVKQIQLEARTTDPSDDDLVNGRIYYSSADNTIYAYLSDAFVDLGAGAGSGDITSVVAGAGLTGGATSGVATLQVVNTDGKITVGADTIDITAASLVNADIATAAAIAWSKMASSTDIHTDGTVTDLTITSEAQGTILYRDASAWVVLAPGTSGTYLQTQGASADPQWATVTATTSSGLSSPFSLEGGTYDPVTTVTSQTSSAAALTIPDLAGVAQEWVFSTKAVTLLNKTLDDATCKFGDTADATKDLFFSLGGATTAKTMTILSSHTDDRTLTLPDATDTLVGLATTDTLTNKTLTTPIIATTGAIVDAGGDEYVVFTEAVTPVTYIGITSGNTTVSPQVRGAGETNTDLLLAGTGTGNVYIGDGADITKDITFELSGATTAKTMTITSSQTDDRTLTLPDATDTLIGKATTDVLTNKTLDCNGTGNVVTNVGIDELDPVGDAAAGVRIVFQKSVTALAAAGTNIITTHKKVRIINAHFVATSADSGTICVHAGQVGSVGTAITDVITVAAADKGISKAGTLDDAVWDLAEDGGLVAVGDGGASIDGVIFVECIRID